MLEHQSVGTDPSTPNQKQLDKFEFHKAGQEDNIRSLEERIAKQKVELESVDGDVHPRIYGVNLSKMAGLERGLRVAQGVLEFMRPTSDEDVAYRLRVYNELPETIQASFPVSSPIRFHGSPIDRCRDIITSGGISSSVDREGISTSFDGGGYFSVSTPEMPHTTVHDYTDVLRDDCVVPTGCIFVLLPASEEDAEAGKRQIMGNIDFSDEPNRLFGIMTSPENIPRVQNWCETYGVEPSLVGEFFEKTDELANQHDRICHVYNTICHGEVGGGAIQVTQN